MHTLPSWQLPFLGLKEFPSGLTKFEVDAFFQFSEQERIAIYSRRRSNLRIAAALHVGFLKMTGTTMTALDRVPLRVLWCLGRSLDLPCIELATLQALYRRRERTLFDHQHWAMELLSVRPFTDRRQRAIVRAYRSGTLGTPTASELVLSIRSWLFTRKILIPGERRIKQLAHRLHQEAERTFGESTDSTISQFTRDLWWEALYKRRLKEQTYLEWLQTGIKKRSPSALLDLVERLNYLRFLDVHNCTLSQMSLTRQRQYAQRCRRRKPRRLKSMSEPARTLELASFLWVVLFDTTDLILAVGDFCVTDLRRRAKQRADAEEQNELVSVTSILRQAHQLAADNLNTDFAVRQFILDEVPQSVLEPCTRAERFRRMLVSDRYRVLRLLRQILSPQLEHRADSRVGQLLEQWRSMQTYPNQDLSDEFEAVVPKCWQSLANQSNRKLARHAVDCAVLLELQKALRNGTVWAPLSMSYVSRHAMFLSDPVWRKERRRHYSELALPKSFSAYLAPRLAALKAGLSGVEKAISTERVTIDQHGVHLNKLLVRDADRALNLARTRMFKAIGAIQLPEIIVDMDREVRFSWILLGREPRNRNELLTTYGALLAHGTSRAAAGVARMMPGVSESAIADAMHLLERDSALRKANDTVNAFTYRHTITHLWGSGRMASADSMSLDASRHLWNARVDPRRRTYGIGIYQHLLDKWRIVYDQPVVLNTRQAGAAIEGAVRQSVTEPIEQLAVDTHGYTDFAMGLARLLGFDLCPRLKNMRDRKLHVPKEFLVPSSVLPITKKDVGLHGIEPFYDDLVRIAASIRSGRTSAVTTLQRFGAAARGDPLYRAGMALGQLERSLFLCDVMTNDDFRQEMSRALAYVESFHALQRAIYFGSIRAERGRRSDELLAISGSLTLLTNLVMAWNTHQMQNMMLQNPAIRNRIDSDHLRHMAPTHHRNINFDGQFEFPIEQAAKRLMPKNAAKGR